MSKKTIGSKYKSANEFHKKAKGYYVSNIFGSDRDAFYSTTFSYAIYNSMNGDELAGHLDKTIGKLMAEMAQDFNFIKRKIDLWNKVYNKLDSLFNLFQWRIESKDTYSGKKKHSSHGRQLEESRATPILETMGDGRPGVNWGELNKTIQKGYYQDGKFSPNIESDLDDGWKFNTTTHKEQKNQQIARIITAMMECEVFFSDIIAKYRRNYCWNVATAPGDFHLDYTGKMSYIPPKEAEEELDESGNIKPKSRPDLDDISEEVWLQKKEQGEAVESTHYLEYLVRLKKRKQLTLKSKTAAAQEVDLRNIKAIEKMMKGFSRPVYISDLGNYDKVMLRIEGFKNFKAELRLKLELMWDDKLKGLEPRQKNYCLLGKPGVGKTEIVKQLAKAWRRPLIIISMGGATDTKDIEGTPPTFQSANWSRLMEGMSMVNVAIFVNLNELKEQLVELEAITNKTLFQEQEIKEIKELVKDMEEKGETERKVDANSKASIVLFDEAEKVSNSAVLDALGKVLDPNVNSAHWDKFFEGLLNLKYCVFFLTMNWEERCPKFIKDRCQMVDIELLTYSQRIGVLKQFSNRFIRQAWPIMKKDVITGREKPDLNANKAYEENDLLTTKQQQLRDKIGEGILKACVTETWGVRQAILNLGNVIDLMRVSDKDGKLDALDSLDNWNWDSDKDGTDDEVSDKTRTLKYDELTDSSGRPRPLQLTKLTDQDFIPQKKNKKWARVQTCKNTIPSWPGYQPEEDNFFEPKPRPDNSGFGFGTGSGSEGYEQEIQRLKDEIDKIKQHCKEKLAEKEKLTEQQKTLLETIQTQLESSKGSEQELKNTVERLTKQLEEAGTKIPSREIETQTDDEPTVKTLIIKSVPADGKLRFGVNNFQQSVQVLQFDKENGEKIKNLRITDCKNLIQVDLTNLINLEKISLRGSKWDSIKGADKIIPEYKLVIKDCENVSLTWVEGTNVGTIEIDKPSEK